ncbi:hypothetical protein CLV78_102290 [Aliiruegeria haliotis]|uniref:Uncharacterized protein n=1 Tax=Aliiruegeria haliotis TaxID=1280846 RepID=A0A2T0RVN4_9RHOB|nr:hypothetical protein [Aliiruegeria haliotis]PRY25113.1 hypothetical protein CLV78_102290 [Aliiruegeria haliotis]
MIRPALCLGAFAVSLLAGAGNVAAADHRVLCLEHVKALLADPRPEGSPKLGDCVRDDITTGQVDMQSMGFAALSDQPARNVQKLIDAGFPVATGQGVVVIGTLNKLFVEGRISGEAYLQSSEPLVDAGALIILGDGPLDVLSELLRNAPEPQTVCGFAEIVGGFDVFEDRTMPRQFAADNPAFDTDDLDVLRDCGL